MPSRGRRVDRSGRSKGDGQFIPLAYVMVTSEAFRSLSGPALKVWIEVRRRYNGRNNGQLTLSMDEAARLLHLSKSTVQRAIAELINKGFMKRTRKGQWHGRL